MMLHYGFLTEAGGLFLLARLVLFMLFVCNVSCLNCVLKKNFHVCIYAIKYKNKRFFMAKWHS